MKKLTIYLIAFYCIFFTILILLCVEFYYRFDLAQKDRHNFALFKVNRANPFLTEAYEDSLWDIKWWSYKKNRELTKTVNGQTLSVKMNNHGLRAREISQPKPKKTCRIVCIGGSTTVEGMTNETTYPALLEKRLREYYKNDAIEVINCGISGLHSESERKRLLEFLQFDPDIIIEYNCVNDIFWVMLYHIWAKEEKPAWIRIVSRSVFFQRRVSGIFTPKEDYVKNFYESFTMPNLRAIHDEAISAKIEIIFCSFIAPDIRRLNCEEISYLEFTMRSFWQAGFLPLRSYISYVSIYNGLLKRMCEVLDVDYIPLAEKFEPKAEDFTDIAHMTPKGIEKKTNIIFDYLIASKTIEKILMTERYEKELDKHLQDKEKEISEV